MDNIRIALAREITSLVEALVDLGCDRILAMEAVDGIFDKLGIVEGYGFNKYRFARIAESDNNLNNKSNTGNGGDN